MKDFARQHRDTFWVESISRVLQIAPSAYRRYAAQKSDSSLRCHRTQCDEALMPQIQRFWQENMHVYLAEKVWRRLEREPDSVCCRDS